MGFEMEDLTVNVNGKHALTDFIECFGRIFRQAYNAGKYKDIIILCIGTDRSTGDCLGPLVGHKLKLIHYRDVFVYGTLEEPVHAKNLCSVMEEIHKKYKDPFIIAVDACLGKPERIGCISIGIGPLKPGAGVNKTLPEVGHIHIMGIVNISGFMEYLVLQNTRLSHVMKMADTIANGIHYNIWKHIIYKKSQLKEPLMEL